MVATRTIPSPHFRVDSARSYGDVGSGCALVHAENLAALEHLRATCAERFRCVYFDPPFNTGRAFAEYDDRRESSAWRAMMHARLAAARPLLAKDGAIFVEIDDTELAHLQLAMDDVFGRENRVSTITIVRSAPTGHKAINRGPVNVADYLLVYAKDKTSLRLTPQFRARPSYDRAYSTFLVHRDEKAPRWRFAPLASHVRSVLARPPKRAEIEAFALANAESVVRFAQPRYEAVSKDARALIDRSRAEPERVFVLRRARHKDMIFRAGNRVLFLADKVRTDARGERVLVEPLTNVWDDVPFQGIAREGGVVFSRNKKPERLVARILAMSTEPGDWVLDAFLGSGTTTAVAQKMGRRWIGIEEGPHFDALCLPRMRRVVDGSDETGVTREFGWRGGGGFAVLA
jgi:adenine-specific DNA-methyltransferase